MLRYKKSRFQDNVRVIGQQTAWVYRKCFEIPVLYYDIVEYSDMEMELGARRETIENLFEESDVISINLPLISKTLGIVNASLLQ